MKNIRKISLCLIVLFCSLSVVKVKADDTICDQDIIHSYWGSSPVEYNEGILYVYNGTLSRLHSNGYVDSLGCIFKNDVISIVFMEDVLAPVDSSNLFSDPANNDPNMFVNLRSIENAHLLDVSNVTNMKQMFYGAKKLESVDVSNWDTSQVKDMSGMFGENDSLSTIDVSNWVTNNVIHMNNLFAYASHLEYLDVSNWNTDNVETMHNMFQGTALTTLDVSRWNTSKVKTMNHMFQDTANLINIPVSNWDTGSVETMQSMFADSVSIQSLDLNNWNTSNVRNMQTMFYNTRNLENIALNNWDTSNVVNMIFMFGYATSLQELDISGWDTSGVGIYRMQNMLSQVPLRKLVVGPLSTLDNTIDLMLIQRNEVYTGDWINLDNYKVRGDNSHGFMDYMNEVRNEVLNSDNTHIEEYVGTYVWEEYPFIINFDSNGGNGYMDETLVNQYDRQESVLTNLFTYEGYEFKGWSLEPQGTIVFDDNQIVSYTVLVDLKYPREFTLYAIWEVEQNTSKPEDPKPEEPKPQQPEPEKPQPEEPKPQQPEPEKPQPEEPNPQQPEPEKPEPEKPQDNKPEIPQKPIEQDGSSATTLPNTGNNELFSMAVSCGILFIGLLLYNYKKILR